jgi:hypothetical protein
MKKILLLLTSVFITLVLPGCFQSETTIHLNKDGSGTLVEETRLGAQMLAMMDQMAGMGGDAAKADPLAQMFSEDKAKARAATLGEGVTFEKTEPVNADGAKGARVTYRFKDINQLKVSTTDSVKNMSPMGDMGAPAAKKTAPISFSYAAGKLTIQMPEPPKPDATEAPAAGKPEMPDMDNPEAQAMMKQMMGDMKMSLKVVIEPGIAETNATHHDGNTVTLMEMNMGKLVENADTLKKLGKVDQKDPAAAMEALKGIEGVKFEAQRQVTVTVN